MENKIMKTIAIEAWDDNWKNKNASGKWKDDPDYGLVTTGIIALQEHGRKAYFKNIIIRKI